MKNKGWCTKCGKEFKGLQLFSLIIYDECLEKTCPKCKKVRKLGKIEVIDGGGVSSWDCLKCRKMTDRIFRIAGNEGSAVCSDCFVERESKKGCVCYANEEILFCSICDKVHDRSRICEECIKKQTASYKNTQTFLKFILPTAIIFLIIGFFLGWLFLVKFRKKKKKKKRIHELNKSISI